jgi:cytochrome c oxidase subunit 1
LLYIGAIIALFIFIYLWFFAPKSDQPIEYPVGEVSEHAAKPPRILENWTFWIGLSLALSLFAYTFPFIEFFVNPSPGSLPIRSW